MLDGLIRDRLAALIEKGEAVLRTYKPRGAFDFVDERRYAEWKSQSMVLLAQVFDTGHTYSESFGSQVDDGARARFVKRGLGILQAALDDMNHGYLQTVRELASAEVFSDLLEQADHLLENGYSAPAASLAGAVLENGLRSLATRKGIAVKARDNLQSLNNKIADKGVYDRLRQKQVSFWIGVRNAADHGNFDELTDTDVADLIKGVGSLLGSVA
ncbi:MAG: hypothetical protein OXD34_03470 [bacterium]|nr:hypothetical protein [bacterium]